MNSQKSGSVKNINYTHLSEQDLTEGKELSEMIENMDPLSRILVSVYARGLRDMQESSEKLPA